MELMDSVVDSIPNISVITKIELLGFNAPHEHYQLLVDFVGDANLFILTEHVVDKCIEVRRDYKTKLPDAIIAATALVHGLSLLTRNAKDFQLIKGLVCINPYTL